ncbi:MAG TPA: glycosyltransferase [Flavobacterium sp.]|jgi:N-acetylgalactosamine-N,N'-diacetylbacillosaminyl-diphospho-undecaprenol 4-alpha-N-acetylgalactosaminyltransferase
MINQRRVHKIAMIGDSLSIGGAERVHAVLSEYFQHRGIDVHNCIFTDKITYRYGGKLLNLGKVAPGDVSPVRKLKRFLAMRKFIRENNFDSVIDFRMRQGFLQELMISAIYPKGSIYTVHHSVLEFYLPKSSFAAKLIYKQHRLVGCSKWICERVTARKIFPAVTLIYNPVSKVDLPTDSSSEAAYIVSAGRMKDNIKQFDGLIRAYSQSELPQKNIKLMLLGEGQNLDKYQQLARELGVADLVVFQGFVDNPFAFYKNALFYVLSSKQEGFPMGLIECLSMGTPVVAFDCLSGPSEIIRNHENGLLVEDQNFERLREAINEFVEDRTLYLHCKANAHNSVQRFSIDTIGRQWLEYLKIELN